MKSKAVLLMVIAGFLLIFACTNPVVEEIYKKDKPTPEDTPAVNYTVAFNSNGGSAVANQIVGENGTASRPPNPTKDGYAFDNWYADSTLATLFNFNTPIMGNTTLYAKWFDQDFPREVIHNIFNVSNTAEWNTAVSAISGGGDNKTYIINVIADFNVAGVTSANFGNVSGIKVSLRGEGRTLTLSSTGNLLHIGSEQTVILRELTLVGHSQNNNSVVYVYGIDSYFTMQSGKITGNFISGSSPSNYVGGGGVCVLGTFTMNDGEISDNDVTTSWRSVWGGGVYVSGTFIMNGGKISDNKAFEGGGVNVYNTNSTFTMNGGEISGNTADYGAGVFVEMDATSMMHNGKISSNTAVIGGGVYVCQLGGTFIMYGGEITGNKATTYNPYGSSGMFAPYGGVEAPDGGGGVYTRYQDSINYGIFLMVEGIIYGNENTVDSNLRNTAIQGAALYKDSDCFAQYGTFSGATWNSYGEWKSNGNLNTTNNTIRVKGGVLQQ